MIYTLFKLNLNALFARVFMRGTKKGAGKGRAILFTLLFIYLAATLLFSFGMLCSALIDPFFAAGIGWMYFALMGSAIFALCVLHTIFIAGAQLFKAKDNESLLAMPVKPHAILLSRLLVMLFFEYLTALLVLVPAGFLWLQKGYGSLGGLLWLVVGFVLLPLLASTVSLLLAWLLTVLSKKRRGKNLMTMVLSLSCLFLYIYGYMNIQSYLNQLVSKGEAIAAAYQKALPPFYAFGMSVTQASALQGFVFAAWAIVPFAATLLLLSSRYLKIITTSTTGKKMSYKEQELRSSGILLALIRKELAHFFSLPIVMLNSSLGSIFVLVGAVLLLIKRGAVIAYAKPFLALVPGASLPLIAALAVMLIGMTNNLSSSLISLEGKHLWISKSSPVATRTLLRAKVYTHVLVSNLPCLLAAIIAALALGARALDALTLIVLPQTFLLLAAFGGLAINLRFPRLDWLNEVQVVKQSASVMISLFSAMALFAGLAFFYYFALKSLMPAQAFAWLCAALFTAATLIVKRYLQTGGAKRFEKLS
jgi:ABC-2 type transport system permease protein